MPKYLRYATPEANLKAVHLNLARFRIISENVRREPKRYPFFIGELKELILELLSSSVLVTEEEFTMLLDLIVIVDDAIISAVCLSGKRVLLDVAMQRYFGDLEEHFSDILLSIIAVYDAEYTEKVVNNFLEAVKKHLGFVPLEGGTMDLLYVLCSRFCKTRSVFNALMMGADPTKPTKVGLSYSLSISNYYKTYYDIDSQIDIATVVSLLVLFGANSSDKIYAPEYSSVHGSSLHSLIARSAEPLPEERLGSGGDVKMPSIDIWLEYLHNLEVKGVEDKFYVGIIRIIDSKPQAIDKKIISPLYVAALFHIKAKEENDAEMLYFSYQLFHKLIDIFHMSTIFTLSVANYTELRSFIRDNDLEDLDGLLDSMEDYFLTSVCCLPKSVETMGATLPSGSDYVAVKGALKLG